MLFFKYEYVLCKAESNKIQYEYIGKLYAHFESEILTPYARHILFRHNAGRRLGSENVFDLRLLFP